MRHVFWIVLLALTAVPVARAGYMTAQWGMTPEQVAAAVPEAKLHGRGVGDRLDNMVVRNVGEIFEGTRRYWAAFYYDQRGLGKVELKAPAKDCKDVLQDILDAQGNPYRTSDQALFRLFIWHDASQSNRLRLMVSLKANVCTLYYERLEDYKAVDDEQAAKGL